MGDHRGAERPLDGEELGANGRRRRKDEPEPAPEANGQAQPGEATPAAQEQAGQDAKPDDTAVDGRTAKKAKAKAS